MATPSTARPPLPLPPGNNSPLPPAPSNNFNPPAPPVGRNFTPPAPPAPPPPQPLSNNNPPPASPPANSIQTTPGNDTIVGDGQNNTIFGSAGNDTIDGSSGTDTLIYNLPNQSITLQAGGVINKGTLGQDRMNNIETVVGPRNQPNTIDGSTGVGVASLNIDLSANRLAVNNLPTIGTLNFTVENFVNAIGTPNIDSITGNDLNNFLNGGAGSDNINGRGGDDVIIGVNPTNASPGSTENDVLSGGLGRDLFILGQANQSFYSGTGSANITDFERGIDRIQLSGGAADYAIVGNSISRAGDLIATVNTNINLADILFA